MSPRRASLLAWSLWATFLVLLIPALVLQYLNDPALLASTLGYGLLFLCVVATLGALVASRHPANPIGWIFCAVGLTNALWLFAQQYAIFGLITRPGVLPGAKGMAALATEGTAVIGWGLMATFVPLLFPTGRLPSPRWRPVALLAALMLVAWCLTLLFKPGPIDEVLTIPNPLGIESAAWLLGPGETLMSAILVPVAAVCIAALFLRFRRGSRDEQQQLKWLAYSAALLIAAIVIQFEGSALLGAEAWRIVEPLVFALPFGGMAVATAIAIFKYRLYDIDLIIRRTLVYGMPTAALALIYFGGVALLQFLSRAITGGSENQPQWVIVASTLVIAALFQPLRHAIQRFIDRRFYRSRYNAAQTLAEFSARLRDKVEMDGMSDDLLKVVQDTVQPVYVALWIRTRSSARGMR